MAGPETIDPHGLKYVPAADFGSRKLHEKKEKRTGTTFELGQRPCSL